MYHKALSNISNTLLELLFLIKDTMLTEKDLIKGIPCPPKELEIYLEKYPLPPSHLKVISYLVRNNSCPVSQIAKSLNISKSNMTPIIDKLISYNLVKRFNDLEDRRIIRVELTQTALEMFNNIKGILSDRLCNKLSTLSDEDIDILNSSVNNLYSIIKKL